MAFFETYGKEVVSLLVPVITWLLNRVFKARTRLQVALPHQFTFLVQQPRLNANGEQVSPIQTVTTRSFIIRNAGREAATRLEVVFNWKPMCLNLWPVRHYDEHVEQDGRYILIFESLAPAEVLGMEILTINGDLPDLSTVRCTQCLAQNIHMYPQPVVSRRFRRATTTLMALGLATTVYLGILLVQFLVLKTPFGH